jgi:D-inositol-3-phosphate glycosyltransferase
LSRIAIIGSAHPLRGGGLSTFNMILARELQQLGHEVVIFTFSLQYPSFLFPGSSQYTDEPAPDDLDIRVTVNSINPFNWVYSAYKIRKWNPDLVILRYWIPFMGPCLGTIARLLRLTHNCRLVAITDNIVPHEKRPGDKLFTTYFLGSCHGYLSMSKAVLQDLKSFTNKPAVYHPHPLYNNFGPALEREQAAQQLQLDPNDRYLLFFGFIRKYKGLDLLLKAFADERLRAFPVKLIIAGEFYTDPEEYEAIISAHHLEPYVVRHHRFIKDEEVSAYFSLCDMVVQTYHHATQSGVTQVAYYYGKPMLVTNVGGLAELIPHGKVGYVVDINEVAISDALVDFFSNERLAEFSENAILERSKFSWENLIHSLIHVAR